MKSRLRLAALSIITLAACAVFLSFGTSPQRSELLARHDVLSRGSEIVAINRGLNLRQQRLDVAVAKALHAAFRVESVFEGITSGSTKKGTKSMLYLPTDEAPDNAMIKESWDDFTELPPSSRPGFGMAESSASIDARIANLQQHRLGRNFERSAKASTTLLSSVQGRPTGKGHHGRVFVRGFIPAWRPWEFCSTGSAAHSDNNADLCIVFRAMGDFGVDGFGERATVRFAPSSGPSSATLAQEPVQAQRATELLSAALRPLNRAQAVLNLERLLLARELVAHTGLRVAPGTLLDYFPGDFELDGYRKDISGGNDGGYGEIHMHLLTALLQGCFDLRVADLAQSCWAHHTFVVADAPFDFNGDGQEIDNWARVSTDWSYTQPAEGYLFPYGPSHPDMAPPAMWARGNLAQGNRIVHGSHMAQQHSMLAGWNPDWTQWAGWTAFTSSGAMKALDATGVDLTDTVGPPVEEGWERAKPAAGDHHAAAGLDDGAPAYMNMPREGLDQDKWTWQGKLGALFPSLDFDLDDVEAPLYENRGTLVGDYMHHAVAGVDADQVVFVNTPEDETRVQVPGFSSAVSEVRNYAEKGTWFEDETHHSGVQGVDDKKWIGSLPSRKLEVPSVVEKVEAASKAASQVMGEPTRANSGEPEAAEDLWPFRDISAPAKAVDGDIPAGDYLHHAVGAAPVPDESFVDVPLEGPSPVAGSADLGELPSADYWPFQDVKGPRVADATKEAGDYMHHAVGAAPLAGESFVKVHSKGIKRGSQAEAVSEPKNTASGEPEAAEDLWPFRDISAPAKAVDGDIPAGDYLHHAVGAAPVPEESFVDVPLEGPSLGSGEIGRLPRVSIRIDDPFQDVKGPRVADATKEAGDYMHHAVGAAPLADESYVDVPGLDDWTHAPRTIYNSDAS